MKTQTRQTLEKIIDLVRTGFTFPKTEIQNSALTPKFEQEAYHSIEGGDSVGDCSIPSSIRVKFFGLRDYYTPSGEYLFTQELPAWGRENRTWYEEGPAMHPESYIDSRAPAPKKELKLTKKTTSGKLFWIPYKFTINEIRTLPPKSSTYKNSKGKVYRHTLIIKGELK
jgi:hypothetical protein